MGSGPKKNSSVTRQQAKRLARLLRVMFNPWHMGNEASDYLKTRLTGRKVAL